MRLKSVFLFCLLISAHILKAQFNNDFLFYEKYGNSVNLNTEYEINSSAVQNDLVNKFIYGGYIDSITKARSQKRLKAQNRIGGSYATGATAFFGIKDSKYHIMAGLKQVEFVNASFSGDVFNLVFYGNKIYEGKTANISNTNVNHLKYQEIKLGLVYDNSDTTTKFGGSVSYLKGQSFFQVNTVNASIYTAPDGSQIDFNMHGSSMALSDTGKGKSSFKTFNGNGALVELFASVPYTSALGASKFFVSINNLGFIKWNKNTVNYSADTNYSFKGVSSNNIFQLNDASVKNLSKDSLVKHLTKNGKQSFSTNLPVSLFLLHTIKFNTLFTLNTGFRNLFNANYKPYLYAEGQFTLPKNFMATANIGYGGYGKLSGGVTLQYKVKKFFIRLGSNAIQGYVVPKYTLGQGLFLSLTKKI